MAMVIPADLARLTDRDQLVAHIRSHLSEQSCKTVSIGILVGARMGSVSIRGGAVSSCADDHPGIPSGCLTKLLTAALLIEALAVARLGTDRKIQEILGRRGANRCLEGVSFRQLLEHSHGIDDAAMLPVVSHSDGRMDVAALCRDLAAAPALAAPGQLYSYGSAGALLGAAVLEEIYGAPFASILERQLFAPLAIRLKSVTRGLGDSWTERVCPASGGSVALTVDDVLRFLHHQLHSPHTVFRKLTACGQADVQPLPGWHFTEQGVYFGWKYYGDGWFGHSSEVRNATVLVRMNPGAGVGVVVFSGPFPPTAIARALFRRYLPSVARAQKPPLRRESLPAGELAETLGVYANRANAVSIAGGDRAPLAFRLFREKECLQEMFATSLQPAEHRTFFLRPSAANYPTFVQIVRGDHPAGDYLWTGSRVLKRVARRACRVERSRVAPDSALSGA